MQSRSPRLAALLAVGLLSAPLAGCGPTARAPEPAAEAPTTPPPAQPPSTPPPAARPAVTPGPGAIQGGIGPETISDEGGDAKGVVVLWPRVIPSATADSRDAIAISAQARMSGVVATALPGRPITLRPKPQRSCPQGGCAGLSVGLLLAHVDEGCAAAALIGGPGRSARRIIPWAGRFELKAMQYEFRGLPEEQLTIKEMVPCADLVRAMAERDGAVSEALKFAAKAHAP